ncbi:TetR/AcrR family transcriptional regulator [Amycolatopsis cynarae]|uniref:TetR/AcrR family transcriptional regulator n=1 Tax=Amycolatopsis cynarae TaxID=2995223 RepID=A0ABY7AZJ9_9PSEU|nr:TetR/AcrR family transcriptional regulator [Amycolatopsis sp. HUAS 11-8]WAL65462.1 TetR/AcrR family transcriptional regulator [Amycolatopsis sp. HUAS 11-8]
MDGIVDRRVRRTRQALRRAALDVVRERGFQAARVSDIAERADVNRGTFYAHYADKFALADDLVRVEFHRRITGRMRWTADPAGDVVRQLTLLLWEASRTGHSCWRDVNVLRPRIHQVVRGEMGRSLRQRYEPVSAHLVGSTIVGTVCWWRESGLADVTGAQAADHVTELVLHGVKPL